MSNLNELIAQFCPDGVVFHKLQDIATVTAGNSAPQQKELYENGVYPFCRTADVGKARLSANFSEVEKYLNEDGTRGLTLFSKGSILVPKSGASTLLNHRVMLAIDAYVSSHLAVLKANNDYLLDKFLFYIMSAVDVGDLVDDKSYPSLRTSTLGKIKIPVPPLPVQSEIVRILDNFTELTAVLTAELTTELAARKQQYEYYRDHLLTFSNDVPQVELGDYFPHIRNGFVGTATPYFTTEEDGIRYLKGTNIHNGIISDNDYCYITPAFHQKHIRNELKADDILVVQSGHVGECAVVGEKYAGANCHALIIMSNGGQCSSKFVVHYLHSAEGKRKIAAITTGGTVKHILASEMKKFKIPFPPIAEQERIVALLDRFDFLCHDITLGLPAEIEARKKQYEYYRDKLLTFKELDEDAG